jgi:hypothetical protein
MEIKEAMNWDDEKLNKWFTTDSPFFAGMSPKSFMELRPEKFEKIVRGLLRS